MPVYNSKKEKRVRRHNRIRNKISGTTERPRFCVSITAKHMYVQFIDDENGNTITATSTLDPKFKESKAKHDVAGAGALGKLAGEKAKEAGIQTVVFDRSGFKFHGRIKALADAARESGLKF